MAVGDDSMADDQAQARPGADPFGGKEGFENPRLDLGRNPAPVIDDLNYQLVVFD